MVIQGMQGRHFKAGILQLHRAPVSMRLLESLRSHGSLVGCLYTVVHEPLWEQLLVALVLALLSEHLHTLGAVAGGKGVRKGHVQTTSSVFRTVLVECPMCQV